MKPPVDQRYCTGFAIASGYKTSEYARVEFGAGSESERNTRARYCLILRSALARFVSSVASLRASTALLRGELPFSVPEDGLVPLWNAPRQVDLCQSVCDSAIQ